MLPAGVRGCSFDVEEYHPTVEVGIFSEDDRVELAKQLRVAGFLGELAEHGEGV